MDRKRSLNGRHSNICVHKAIAICRMKLGQRQVTTTPFDLTGQLLESRHVDDLAPQRLLESRKNQGESLVGCDALALRLVHG